MAAYHIALGDIPGARSAARNSLRHTRGVHLLYTSIAMQHLATVGMLDHGLKVRPMVLPDRFIDHDTPAKQYEQAGLTARHIAQTALSALGRSSTTERSARA